MERKERKKEKRTQKRESGAGDDETAEERTAREREYKKSLWPPGTDISLYTFDPNLYWCALSRLRWQLRNLTALCVCVLPPARVGGRRGRVMPVPSLPQVRDSGRRVVVPP